jgi:hypothetical protein
MTLDKLMEQLAQAPAKDPTAELRALREAEIALFAKLTLERIDKVPLIERMALARQLAKNRSTPGALLTLLCNDHYLVSAPVLESAPMLSEAELVDIIARHGAPVCLAIAKRDELSVQLTDMMMADAEPKVQQTLAGNTGARLSRKSMIALCDLAESDENIRQALAKRRDLPLALVSRLKAPGSPETVASPTPARTATTSSGPGRGRAGIVLSSDLLNAPPKRKEVKTIRYS